MHFSAPSQWSKIRESYSMKKNPKIVRLLVSLTEDFPKPEFPTAINVSSKWVGSWALASAQLPPTPPAVSSSAMSKRILLKKEWLRFFLKGQFIFFINTQQTLKLRKTEICYRFVLWIKPFQENMCCFYHPASIQLIFCNPPPLALPLSKVNICDTKNLNHILYWWWGWWWWCWWWGCRW